MDFFTGSDGRFNKNDSEAREQSPSLLELQGANQVSAPSTSTNAQELERAKRILGQENTQMFLVVAWRESGTEKRNIDMGRVTIHVGDLLEPPLTAREMQFISFAAKMEFARVCKRRKRRTHR